MKLNVEWNRWNLLTPHKDGRFGYYVDIEKLPDTVGVYIFGRCWGKKKKIFEALYVGKAINSIQGRVKDQLKQLPLMNHLKSAQAGKRFVIAGKVVTEGGKVVTRKGPQLKKGLRRFEQALIRYFMLEGHNLFNKKGVRLRSHKFVSSGKYPKSFIPIQMYLEKTKRA